MISYYVFEFLCNILTDNKFKQHWEFITPVLFINVFGKICFLFRGSDLGCTLEKQRTTDGIRRSHKESSIKIHAPVNAYEYPAYLIISEGQCNDINCRTPLRD